MCKWGKMSQEHAPPFVALRQEREEHFHLFPVLLYVTQVGQKNGVKVVELAQQLLQSQIAFGGQ